jgi:hypothetical protein
VAAAAQPGVSMAHFKCAACRARVWRAGAPEDHRGDLCPGCGGPLESVEDLSALVGLRSLRARPRSAQRPDRSTKVADLIRETIARHDAEGPHRRDDGTG